MRYIPVRPGGGALPEHTMEPLEVRIHARKMLISLLVLPFEANLQRVLYTCSQNDRHLPGKPNPI